MKRQLMVLFPYKFTRFEYYKFELANYNFKIDILDLSNHNKKLSRSWKSSRHPKVFAPKNLISLHKYFKSKVEKKPVILNFNASESNLWAFWLKFLIKKHNLKEIVIREKAWDIKTHKDFSWFLKKLKEHNLNFKVYFFYLRYFFLKFFNTLLLQHKNEFIFTNEKFSSKYIHNFDYSNSIGYLKNKNKQRCVLYLDNGGPYFTGDTFNLGNKLPNYNISKIYKDYQLFFNKIQKDFKCKLIIVPHPKYKSANRNIKSYNPYFNNFKVDNSPDAINKLSNNTIFFLSKGSLASAYATIFNKPIVFFYSSDHPYEPDEFKSIKEHSEILGTKPFDIKKYKKISFKKQLKIKKKSYTKYFNSLLRPNQKLFDKKNSTLISEFINSLK